MIDKSEKLLTMNKKYKTIPYKSDNITFEQEKKLENNNF